MGQFPRLTESEVERISNILGDTASGFTGSEIGRLLEICHIPDAWPNGTKRIRIFNSLAEQCNRDQTPNCVYRFIQEALMPSRWLDAPSACAEMRTKVNEVLLLKGLRLTEENQYEQVKTATTISEAKQRASQLGKKMYDMHMHPMVLSCCKEELLVENYFHAVLEAAKSLTDRIAEGTNLHLEGTKLIERAFSIENPAVVMNTLRTKSEQNQHRGLKERLLGINYAVRNVTAHELKIKWAIEEDSAINMLSIISALHKELDNCHFIWQL